MNNITFYAPSKPPAIRTACSILSESFPFVTKPAKDVTHLLLPVPSFEADGRIRGGGILENILADCSEGITVIGGNLQHPSLAGYTCIDLLQDSEYVAKNAALTADCTVRVIGQHLQESFEGCRMLIVGWGRISKCLAPKLCALGAVVGIATRKAEDRHLLEALGYEGQSPEFLTKEYRVVVNTAPAPVLTGIELPKGTLKIELASVDGLTGNNVVVARGLPGKMVSESSGQLIAQRVANILTEGRR